MERPNSVGPRPLPGESAHGKSRPSGIDGTPAQEIPKPEPEIALAAKRRTYTAEYKERILAAVDACRHGELGVLLRSEGLHSSTVQKWRAARDRAIVKALQGDKPGPVPKKPGEVELEKRVAELERELKRVQGELSKAKVIIDVQKKVSELLADLPDESDETS